MDNEKLKQIHNKLVSGVRDYFKKNRVKKAVIGLSGGIDSSLSARLVADAIGKENIHGLIMPLKGLSSEENIQDAIKFCTLNGIDYSLVFINDFIKKALDDHLHKHADVAEALQKRILQSERERKDMAGIKKLANQRAKKANLHNKKLRDCKIHLNR